MGKRDRGRERLDRGSNERLDSGERLESGDGSPFSASLRLFSLRLLRWMLKTTSPMAIKNVAAAAMARPAIWAGLMVRSACDVGIESMTSVDDADATGVDVDVDTVDADVDTADVYVDTADVYVDTADVDATGKVVVKVGLTAPATPKQTL